MRDANSRKLKNTARQGTRNNLASSQGKAFKDAVLKFIHLRYYPPGLILQYLDCQGRIKEKVIELLELNYSSSVPRFSSEILKAEPLLFSTKNHRTALVDALAKLKERCLHDYAKRFMKQYAFFPHSSSVTKMCLSKDGKKCITTSSDEHLCSVWDLGGMRETALLHGHTAPISAISLSHHAYLQIKDKALTGSEDGTIRLWEISCPPGFLSQASNTATNQGKCQSRLNVTKGKVCCAETSSDFSMAASGCSDAIAYVHDLTNGIAMYKFADSHTCDITNIQFDTAGNTLLTSSIDGKAALWDLRSGSLISMLEGHNGEIVDCLFDHMCQTVATCSLDTKVRVWDVRMMGSMVGSRGSSASSSGGSGGNPSLLYEFTDNDDEVLSIHFDARGNYLASGSKDGTLCAWDIKTGNLHFHIPSCHESAIRTVRWSPNGALVMTASDDKTVSLYHPDMATCIQTLSHHKAPVTHAFFSYSNEYLVTSGADRSVVLYRLEKPLKNEPFVLSPNALRSARMTKK